MLEIVDHQSIEIEIPGQWFCSWHQLELCHEFQDPVASYMQLVFSKGSTVAPFEIKTDFNNQQE